MNRQRSIEAITSSATTPITNGNIPNGRQLNGILTRGSGGLHEDHEFPPTLRTLTRKKTIIWMRPHVNNYLLLFVFKLISLLIKMLIYYRKKNVILAHLHLIDAAFHLY